MEKQSGRVFNLNDRKLRKAVLNGKARKINDPEHFVFNNGVFNLITKA